MRLGTQPRFATTRFSFTTTTIFLVLQKTTPLVVVCDIANADLAFFFVVLPEFSMSCPTGFSSAMDIDDSSYSRWSYATSDARSEPMKVLRAMSNPRSRTPQPASHLPPISVPPAPVQTSLGVWEDEDGVYYASNWPPVQEYLDLIRKERRMVVAPSEIIFVLAALDVVQCPWDVAHWIFWPSLTYYSTADRVTAVALHQPRLIMTKVPWIGSREYKWIINAIQEKYYYVHVLKKWYPTDFQLIETKKRTLRSNGCPDDRQDVTINQHFNIVDDGTPPLKRLRSSAKKVFQGQPAPEEKRFRTITQPRRTVPSPGRLTALLDRAERADSSEASAPILSGRIKRRVSPSARSLTENPVPDDEPELSSSPHSRNRSTSQSSEKTVVADDDTRRSASVESSKTVIGSSPTKKRKADVLDEDVIAENQGSSSQPREGMITRGLSMKITRAEFAGKKAESATQLSPTTRIKPTQLKAKSRKSRS